MKSGKIILILFGIYFIVMMILFLPNYLNTQKEKIYIMAGDFIKIKLEKGTWSNIENSDDYRLKEFTVYENDQYKGNYKLMFTNHFNLYDENGQKQSYSGPIFAYNGTIKTEVYGIENSTLTEEDKLEVQQAFEKLSITNTEQFSLFQKVQMDVDNDGIEEKVICMNDYFLENNLETAFSIVFMVKNNQIQIVESHIIPKSDIYDEPSFEMKKVLDMKKDSKMELLISKNYFSRPEKECAVLYNLKNNKLIKDFCN